MVKPGDDSSSAFGLFTAGTPLHQAVLKRFETDASTLPMPVCSWVRSCYLGRSVMCQSLGIGGQRE